MGNKIAHGQPIRVGYSRYYLSKTVFPAEVFDPYMSGCFLAMTRDVLHTIVERCVDIGPIIYFDERVFGTDCQDRGNYVGAVPVLQGVVHPDRLLRREVQQDLGRPSLYADR